MLTYKLIERLKNALIYEYYPENNLEAPGVVKLFDNGEAEMLQESKDDFKMIYGGHALRNIDRTKTTGTVAWY